MPKLLTTTDQHFRFKEPLGEERRVYKWNKFSHVVDLVCNSSDILGLVILGDLFNNPNPNEELRNTFFSIVRRLFIRDKYLVFTAGNHDSTAIHHCFSGEKNIPYEYMKIFTGTEIQPLGIPGFENFVVAPWYSSLREDNFYTQCKDKFVFGHMEIQGGIMNNNTTCDRGVIPHLLKQNNIHVLSGHFHKQQDTENYSYLGAMFKDNFGEGEYTPCYGIIDENFNLSRYPINDWEFMTINELDSDWNNKLYEFGDTPTAVKFVTKKSIRSGIKLSDRQIKSELSKLGIKNISYFKKSILSENKLVDKTGKVVVEGSILDSIKEYSKTIGFSDDDRTLLTKWAQNANFEA